MRSWTKRMWSNLSLEREVFLRKTLGFECRCFFDISGCFLLEKKKTDKLVMSCLLFPRHHSLAISPKKSRDNDNDKGKGKDSDEIVFFLHMSRWSFGKMLVPAHQSWPRTRELAGVSVSFCISETVAQRLQCLGPPSHNISFRAKVFDEKSKHCPHIIMVIIFSGALRILLLGIWVPWNNLWLKLVNVEIMGNLF